MNRNDDTMNSVNSEWWRRWKDVRLRYDTLRLAQPWILDMFDIRYSRRYFHFIFFKQFVVYLPQKCLSGRSYFSLIYIYTVCPKSNFEHPMQYGLPGRSGLDKRLPRSRRHGRLQLKIVIRFGQIFTWNVTEFPRPEALLVWGNIIRSGVLAGYGRWAATPIYTRAIDPVTCVSRGRDCFCRSQRRHTKPRDTHSGM